MKLPGVFVVALGLATGVAPSLAQDPPALVPVQGVVLDKATRTPIPGAMVRVAGSIVEADGRLPAGTSDGGGRFEMTAPPGAGFNLAVSAAGYEQYFQRQAPPGQNGSFIEVTLIRLAEVRGHIVDDETRKPIPGIHAALVRPDLRQGDGFSVLGDPNWGKIQDDGSFDFKNLTQGDYYLRIESTPRAVLQEVPAKDLAPETRDRALEVPEPIEGYGIVMWPGGDADISQAPPVHIASDVVDLGEIRLRRYKLHNISGTLEGCETGAGLQVLLLGKSGLSTLRLAALDTSCGSGFRILNLSEGTFTLVAQGGPPRCFVSQPINGGTRGPLLVNVSPAVSVRIFIDVEGVARENFPADLARLNIALTPENAPVKIDAPDQAATPGEYEAHLFGNERYRLTVNPPSAYFLKSIAYNGVSSDDLTGFTAVQGLSTLRLLMSNHPGSVEVQGPPRTAVYMLKEGVKFADLNPGDRRVFQQTGADGKAQFSGLSPGTYHAVLAEGPLPFSQAGLDAMPHSAAVTIEEGQTATVTVAP
ncbi:MAG TPA: hypothetical protein VGG72_34595 [Bryobacteraceae bacterium]|jgi:hypothetical protein